MGSDWPELTIDEIKSPIKGAIAMGPFGSRIKAENFVSSGVPVIKGAQLHGAYILDSGFSYLTEDKAEELKNSQAFPGDLVITHRGTLGQVSVIPENAQYEKYVVSQSQLKVSLNKKIVNPYFVNYFFRSPLGQHRLLANASQVGVPAIAKASTSVKAIMVPCPSLEEQNKVVKVLRSLDQKIELNRQMNSTLEGMAQALFKSWFVDFDPVIDKALSAGNPIPEPLQKRASARQALGPKRKPLPADIEKLFPDSFEFTEELVWIPEGWKTKPLDNIAHYQNGLALQKYRPKDENIFLPVVKIADLKKGYVGNEEKASPSIIKDCIIDDGDVVFSWSGSLMVDIWCGGRAALNQHLFKVTSENFPKWFYYQYTLHHLNEFQRIAAGKAVTMGHIKREHLKQAFCAIPTEAIINECSRSIGEWINKGTGCRVENNQLTGLRDTLLPKLLSGELRIPDAEKLIQEAL